VLLVTCLNLVDLILARGHLRRQEMAIRSSLGGDRGRLIRQLLSEGLLLALAGGSAGLLLSMWATNALMASVHPLLPAALSVPELDTDWRVVVASIGFSLAATILFGAGPAWALTGRAAATDLKRHVSAERGRSRGVKVGNGLVIAQIALSLLLLSTGGLFLMSALSAATADPGFRLHGGLVVEVDPSLAGYSEAQARQSHLAIMERLRTVPGVETVSIGSSLPFSSTADSRSVAPAGAADARSQSVDAIFSVVSRDYARSLGLPMLGGRDFTAAELIPGVLEPVAIIDDVLAERLWPGETALGRLIQFLDAQEAEVGRAIRVVGIMPAVNHSLGNAKPFPHVYVPLGQHSESAMTLQLRVTPEDAEQTMLATVARVIRDVDPRVPVVRVETWHDHLDRSLDIWLYRAGARVFSTFGTIALLLAVIGVYGVKSYVVSRRTREFGIRIAIGAHPRAVLWQVLREGGRITCVGVAIGLLLALGAGQLLQGLLYGVAAVEPIVLVTAPLILITASLLASYIPARRAMNVDPSMALRAE
jgi:predicted permease